MSSRHIIAGASRSRHGLRGLAAVLLVVCASLTLAGRASASVAPAPGWELTSAAYPTNLPPGGSGTIEIHVVNTGAAPSAEGEAVTVTDTLPAGLTATAAGELEEGFGIGSGELWNCAGTTVVTCTSVPAQLGAIAPGEIKRLGIAVEVAPSASGVLTNRITVAGGGAPAPASRAQSVTASSASAALGFQSFDAWLTNADGTAATQAGSHPYEFTVAFNLNENLNGLAGGEARNVTVKLPPGVIGDPNAIPQCTREQLDAQQCPVDTQVGVDSFGFAFEGIPPPIFRYIPVYNMVPPVGHPAQFAFEVLGNRVFLDATVRSGSDYGITVHVDNIPTKQIVFNSTTIWGEPADASHNAQRQGAGGCRQEFGGCPSGSPPTPFLTLPTSCTGPQAISVAEVPWQDATAEAHASVLTHDLTGAPVGFTGCNHLGFGPSLSVAPDTSEADTPAGLTTEIKVSQEGLLSPGGITTSNVRDGTVVLPEGVVINPGRATGLAVCPLDQDGVGQEGPPSCPAASQVGTAQVATPLLADKLEGNVYVVQSEPPHVKLLVAIAGDGVEAKLIGNVSLDPVTGRLTTMFEETPELPFTDFKLAFSGGGQAALATPTGCGVYTSTSDFTPWSSPLVEDVFPSSAFQITSGPGESACASPLPFTPVMTAGATTDQAGGYTDFSMLLQRADGQQRISKLQFKTPLGLLGMISHVTLCEEPQASKGECPAGSQIGHTTVGAGPGPYPLFVPEPGKPEAPIYITGPYEGAPYGLSIAVPVIAGPFNLGTTVVRGKIAVDPQTTQLTITTDPLPTILDGVPVDMRTIDAVIDRREFMFNPTNCNPQSFSGTATSTEGTNAPLSSPFQVGSCRSLGFKPTFKVSTSAKTSRTQGASLHVTLTLPDEGGLSSIANVQRVKVSLPKQLPSPLKTLQKACLEKTFAEDPASCPVASQVGQVKVSTPVLPGGLSGTAYFVSHGGAKYPELILVLMGPNGVTVQVHGETFISKQGITSATFATVPDVPFSNFELTLPQREYPALTANGSLCKGTLLMPTEMVGQNGLVIKQSTKIAVTGCPQVKKAAHKRKAKGKRKHPGEGNGKRGR